MFSICRSRVDSMAKGWKASCALGRGWRLVHLSTFLKWVLTASNYNKTLCNGAKWELKGKMNTTVY